MHKKDFLGFVNKNDFFSYLKILTIALFLCNMQNIVSELLSQYFFTDKLFFL